MLIKSARSYIFFQNDQWFNLTAHGIKRTLVNAGMEYHRPQIIPGTSFPNSTSPPSPAPMKSPIHLELTPCDSTSTTSLVNKTCPVNTSCDHLPHLDHSSMSSELTNNSTFGSTEPESIHDPEDLFELECDSTSNTTSMNKTCLLNTSCNHLPHLDHPNMPSELTDNSTVGSTEPESTLDSKDLFQLDSISVSSQASCRNYLLNLRDN